LLPTLSTDENKFVEDAVVLKRFVVVAWVVVERVILLKMLAPDQVLLLARSVVVAPVQPVQPPTVSVPMLAVFDLKSVVEARPET
jgi:hypothetical protein